MWNEDMIKKILFGLGLPTVIKCFRNYISEARIIALVEIKFMFRYFRYFSLDIRKNFFHSRYSMYDRF